MKCAANLRSIGQALIMYTQQFAYYPGMSTTHSTQTEGDVAVWPVSDYGWQCTFVTRNATAPDVTGVERVLYRTRRGLTPAGGGLTDNFVGTVGHAHGVFNALKARPDIRPDLVVAHSGFGSSLFLPHLYDCPVVNFFEYFHRPRGQTLGYRPDVPLSEQALLRSRTGNAMILLDLDNCDAGWCPNYAQRATFPAEYQSKLRVIPEGVDTNLYRRNELAPRRIPGGAEIGRDTRVVTYVSRGFELTRGFDVFLRAAKLILERFPDVLFVVVGTDRTYYGPDRRLTGGASLRERLLEASDLDLSRVHFTGWVPEQTLAEVLSISDLHIYLTHELTRVAGRRVRRGGGGAGPGPGRRRRRRGRPVRGRG